MTQTTTEPNDVLANRWRRYEEEHPRSHARDAAKALDVSEVELVATRCGDETIRLDARFQALLEALPSLGVVKTMTRNASAVIERWGAFERVEIEGAMGQVVGDEIDLRLFMRRWASGFAVTAAGPKGGRKSLQFFDAHGDSIHKVFLEDPSREGAFDGLVAAHRSAAQGNEERVQPRPAAEPERPDAEVDLDGLRHAWDAMTDTHEFFGILRTFRVTRTQALRLAGEDRARPVEAVSLARALAEAAETALPIMVFVGNRGVIQIHSGAVERVAAQSGWLNVLDPRFNLHVREEDLTTGWLVRKPTRDGIVTSLEFFDGAGETILLMFGKRKPGTAEDPAWRRVAAGAGGSAP